jgi:hypothetical protein
MNYLSIHRVNKSANEIAGNGNGHDKQPKSPVITEDSYEGIMALREENLGNLPEEVLEASQDPTHDWGIGTAEAVKARRKWLTSKENRQSLILNENWEIGMEFCNGLLGESGFPNSKSLCSRAS